METSSSLPLSPISIEPEQPSHRDYDITTRRGVGTTGNPIELCTNHFNVSVRQPDVVFYQYTVRFISHFSAFFHQCLCVCEMFDISVPFLQVSITTENGDAVDGTGISRKLMDQLFKTYSSDLDGKRLAYDGEKTLYTVGPLPQNEFDFLVIVEGSFSKRYVPLIWIDI